MPLKLMTPHQAGPTHACRHTPDGNGPNSCKERSSPQPTASGAEELSCRARITHPFHPRRGEEVEVVVRRSNWGEDRIFYRGPHGHIASMPARWTNLAPDNDFIAAAAGRAQFRVDDLLELVDLVARLRA